MAIAKQKKKQSDPTSVSSTQISSVSAWALSLRYGNKAEKLQLPNLPDSLSYRVQYIKVLPRNLLEKVVVVALLFYVHGKHLRSCRDGQLT